MNQFEVWRYNFPQRGGEHPVVLISHPDFYAGTCRECLVLHQPTAKPRAETVRGNARSSGWDGLGNPLRLLPSLERADIGALWKTWPGDPGTPASNPRYGSGHVSPVRNGLECEGEAEETAGKIMKLDVGIGRLPW
jgi:hypothetical protein